MNAPTPNVSTDILQVRHTTRYRYSEPVAFGPHRAMFRPHESNDLRLTAFDITTNPPAKQHWVHDVFSNSKVILNFDAAPLSDTLEILCVFNVIRTSVYAPVFPIALNAQNYPFDYPKEQIPDLIALIRPEYDHPAEAVNEWANKLLREAGADTWTILTTINNTIHKTFEYRRREEPGIQAPRETIDLGHGSCRDFAILMIEAVRQLGFAARFVTGYLYDPVASQSGALQGTGATHAWVQVFLPGAGWIEFDPTNGLVASGNLIRTGVARTPSQAVPLDGSFHGATDAFTGMDVDVQILALAPTLHS
ncbi:transglutaminase family protein [Hyphococcus luteus]|uniref:Transglutaminase n=1 Tax=Hyphococcus luteus TaxID=2058213 RepID=A0A2S7JZ86_9PROT|nr:transglutaminase family protein [Marinicaulis flavus]PQA85569.1 transglutaminase [Marinicaulis flavus]